MSISGYLIKTKEITMLFVSTLPDIWHWNFLKLWIKHLHHYFCVNICLVGFVAKCCCFLEKKIEGSKVSTFKEENKKKEVKLKKAFFFLFRRTHFLSHRNTFFRGRKSTFRKKLGLSGNWRKNTNNSLSGEIYPHKILKKTVVEPRILWSQGLTSQIIFLCGN